MGFFTRLRSPKCNLRKVQNIYIDLISSETACAYDICYIAVQVFASGCGTYQASDVIDGYCTDRHRRETNAISHAFKNFSNNG